MRRYITRQGFEKKHGVAFRWVIAARPDSVLVNDLPDLRRLNPEGVVYVPNWGHGFDPRSPDPVKRHPGVNNRFGFGGAGAMRAYHDLYARLCHGGWAMDGGGAGESTEEEEEALPDGVNYEQMLYWYLNHHRLRASPGGTRQPGAHVGEDIRSTQHIPGEFWFLRLRMGHGTTPVEHPGHRPAMVTRYHGGGRLWRGGFGLGSKRWEVWAAATRESWMCQGSRGERAKESVAAAQDVEGDTAGKQSAVATAAALAVECWLRRAVGWVRYSGCFNYLRRRRKRRPVSDTLRR